VTVNNTFWYKQTAPEIMKFTVRCNSIDTALTDKCEMTLKVSGDGAI